MKKLHTAFSLLFFATFFILLSAGCNRSNKQVNFSEKETTELDSFLFSIPRSFPVPGIAIAVVKDDKIYYRAAGRVTSEGNPVKNSTLFFTGNLSEPMVATAVMTLVQAGKLKLDDPVIKHLHYFRLGGTDYQNITIRHLLTNSSGVPHHGAMWDTPYSGNDALERTTRSVHLQQQRVIPAGSRVKRSPYNFDILADLISKVAGVPFEDYVKENVFLPLSMNSSTYYKDRARKDVLAQPHKITNWLTYLIEKEQVYPYNREHAGSIGFHASIKDACAWMYMLLHQGQTGNGAFIDKQLANELIAPQFKLNDNAYIGLGWEGEKKNDEIIFSKNHQIAGFSTDIRLIPGKKAGVLVLSNIGGDFDPKTISLQLLSWLNGKGLVPAKIPVYIPMGKKLAQTGSIDSAIHLYSQLKKEAINQYDFSEEALSQLGVNLFYRINKRADALRVFQFCVDENPRSAYAYLNLAESFLLEKDTLRTKHALARIKLLSIDKPEILPRLAYIKNAIQPRSLKKPTIN